jgi:Fic-DOC domain mobile mystery protein B
VIVDPLWEGGDGETQLSPEDRETLIPKYITVRRELNELEAAGLSAAILWARRRTLKVATLIDPAFMCRLHRQMLGEVWKWAGSYRVRDVSVVPTRHYDIGPELLKLHRDAEYWIKNGNSPDEIAIRFHHRAVLIHPFPNGNGRVTRLVGDLLASALGREQFTWGKQSVPAYRAEYLAALRSADKGDLGPLLALSRKP